MKFLIENWGPIASAEIDMSKPLIVFTGPNGTGKTYVSYLFYNLMSLVGAIPYSIIQQKQDNRFYEMFHGEELEKGLPAQVEIVPVQIFELFQEMLSGKWGKLTDYLDISEISNNLHITITSTVEEWSQWFYEAAFDAESDFMVSKQAGSYTISMTPKSDTKFNVPFEISYLFHKLLFQGVYHPYMLTAERSGIYTFSKELALGRLRDAKIASRYPRPINDSLANAEDLANAKKYESQFAALADQIESDILEGKMMITDEGEIQYQHGDEILSYHLASTMVKTLSPIIFYLRYKAQDNLLLIIDEPEINLHPNNQILLARIFARMINAGLHLLIATHSDYIIRELNNLVMYSNVSESKQDQMSAMGYHHNMALCSQQVGAYLFNRDNTDKVSVKSLPVEDTGFEVATIDDAISCLNKASEKLYYALKDGDEE